MIFNVSASCTVNLGRGASLLSSFRNSALFNRADTARPNSLSTVSVYSHILPAKQLARYVCLSAGAETSRHIQFGAIIFCGCRCNYFGGASVAGLLVTYTREIDFTTLGIIVPLLLISYLTFKTSLGRIEDANQHLTQVNKMYLSTIETLAMAIDAKDQITHGHIRRVQRLAVGLARSMGVNDEIQIRRSKRQLSCTTWVNLRFLSSS